MRRKGIIMKTINNTKIIGIDHGYGNMKTANCCFPTGITAYDSEPLFTADMLIYNGKYYLIGEGHKEFAPDKVKDEDYYVLTLAAIAKELKAENLTEAHIVIAAGLPLTWTSGQKAEFRAYLMKNAEVEFTYKKKDYHIYIDDVRIKKTADKMNELGYRTKVGSKFGTSTTRLLLKNPVYCTADESAYNYFLEHNGGLCGDISDFDGQHGISAYNKTDQEKFEDADSTFISPKFVQLTSTKPLSEWIISVGRHEGFISSQK